MEILWILLGLVIGVLLAWFFLGARHRDALARQESSWTERLREAEAQTEEQRTLHEGAKTALAEAQSREAAAGQRVTALESELADNSQALEDARAEASQTSSQLASVQSETGDLRSKLGAETAARSKLEEKIRAQQEAGSAAAAAGDDSAARVRSLEGTLTARDQRIAALEAEVARLKQRDVAPAAAAVEPAARSAAQSHPQEVRGVVDLDDLKRIKGIGPVLQEKLRRLGITSFRQIAEFTDSDIERVNGVLDFPGRIEREKWVEQARDLTRR